MESYKEEALRAKENAEKKFAMRDFAGAKNYALKAQKLCPELEGISQMVATFAVYTASEVKINEEIDFYSVLGLDPSADRAKVKKQYRKMAVLLHPDKNKTIGADGAFKIVSEAWTLLSDSGKRSSYDLKRSKQFSTGVFQTNMSFHSTGVPPRTRLDTFWTICTSCHVQYEYLRKYVNKRLSCKNCRGVFIAVETGAAPVNGTFPYSAWSYVPENGYGSRGSGFAHIQSGTVCFSGNGSHSGHGSGYFQAAHQGGYGGGVVNGNKHQMSSNSYTFQVEEQVSNASIPTKKRKVEVASNCLVNNGEMASRSTTSSSEVKTGNGNIKPNSKLSNQTENSARTCSAAPAFDARKLLIDKARTEIRKKLAEFKLAAAAAAAAAESEKKNKLSAESCNSGDDAAKSVCKPELKRSESMSITVPDSDFHDFDRDRSEECFKPKQIWALYDEEDGMPRLYCLIRQVISVNPFKIHISYLNSKTDGEFGRVNWIDCGFTKSCGNFRAFNSEIVDQVNVFSHLLRREKAGRGGCVRIYPKAGDIWAVYRNWSPEWDRSTPDKVRHKYEMVEVLDDYSEELGVCVTPLAKLAGFKTVYQRNGDKGCLRWIPRREMVRFSHQVPSLLLKGDGLNLPEGCWDLDPAATPDELLQPCEEEEEEDKASSRIKSKKSEENDVPL